MFSQVIFNNVVYFGSIIMLAVGALLPIVDPLGGAPIFMVMTADLTPVQRKRTAKSVAINSFLLLIASTLIGANVLDFFGVSIPAVQVAGGAVVCMLGWPLLNSPHNPPAIERNSAQTPTTVNLSQLICFQFSVPPQG